MPGGLFITLEGGDGSGKSTQAEVLAIRLNELGVPVVWVREPGGTKVGTLLRWLLKFTSAPRTPETELLLFNASRSQLVSEKIRPALELGEVVVSDRFADSTVAYQGYGRGIPLETVEAVNGVGTGGLKPDLTILLDLPPEERQRRGDRPVDAFEQKAITDTEFSGGMRQGMLLEEEALSRLGNPPAEGRESTQGSLFEGGYELTEVVEFHRRVRQGYQELARREPERWLVIDARLLQEEITQLIWQRVESMLPAAGQVKG